MPFCYVTRPLAGLQSFTGQPEYQGTRSSAEALAEIAQRTGKPVEEVVEFLRHMGEYIVEQTMNCWRVAPIAGWFGYQVTCGGSEPNFDFSPTFKNLAMDMRMRVGPAALAKMKANFEAVNVGHNTLAVPKIVNVTNRHTRMNNSYTPGKPVQVDFANGKATLDPTDNLQGIFFTSTTGIRTRASDYAYIKGMTICCTAPATLTGPQTLSASLILNNGLRTGSYVQQLIPVAAEEESPAAEPPTAPSRKTKSNGKDVELSG